MAYKYISSSGKEYNLFYSKVALKGGKLAKIYFLLPEGKQNCEGIFGRKFTERVRSPRSRKK